VGCNFHNVLTGIYTLFACVAVAGTGMRVYFVDRIQGLRVGKKSS